MYQAEGRMELADGEARNIVARVDDYLAHSSRESPAWKEFLMEPIPPVVEVGGRNVWDFLMTMLPE